MNRHDRRHQAKLDRKKFGTSLTKRYFNEITVLPEVHNDAQPNGCFVDVENKVEEHGGESVFGWIVSRYPFFEIHTHHAVWKKPTGELRTISPQLDPEQDKGQRIVYRTPQGNIESWLCKIKFIVDPSAKPIGMKPNRLSLPSKYIPLVNDPDLKASLKLWSASDEALHKNDLAVGNELTAQAQVQMNKFFVKHGWKVDGRCKIMKCCSVIIPRYKKCLMPSAPIPTGHAQSVEQWVGSLRMI